jgi:putative flippase GtrA
VSFARQFVGYGVASVCALAVDTAVLVTLVHSGHWEPVAAASVSFTLGATLGYLLSVRLAFDQHRVKSRALEFAMFVVLGTVGLAVNGAVIAVTVHKLNQPLLVAKGVAAACSFTCNFVLRRQILFTVPQAKT